MLVADLCFCSKRCYEQWWPLEGHPGPLCLVQCVLYRPKHVAVDSGCEWQARLGYTGLQLINRSIYVTVYDLGSILYLQEYWHNWSCSGNSSSLLIQNIAWLLFEHKMINWSLWMIYFLCYKAFQCIHSQFCIKYRHITYNTQPDPSEIHTCRFFTALTHSLNPSLEAIRLSFVSQCGSCDVICWFFSFFFSVAQLWRENDATQDLVENVEQFWTMVGTSECLHEQVSTCLLTAACCPHPTPPPHPPTQREAKSS